MRWWNVFRQKGFPQYFASLESKECFKLTVLVWWKVYTLTHNQRTWETVRMKEEWKKNKWPSINLARFAFLSSVTWGGIYVELLYLKVPPHNYRTRMILYGIVRIATTTVECCSIWNPIWNCKLILRCCSVGTCTKNISQSPTWILMALTHNIFSLSVLYTVYVWAYIHT